MRTISRVLSSLLLASFIAAGVVGTSVAGDQRYPVFVPGPSRISGDHCDTFFVQVQAELPDRDHPNNANIRYHLISGPGEINERTGLWSWYPGTSEYEWWQRIEIAASIGNSPKHMTPPEEYRRFTASIEDEYGHVYLDGKPANSVFFVTAPGVHRFDMEVVDPDECDTLPVKIFRVSPRPAGSFFIEDDELIFQAEPADHDKKFLVRLLLPTGPALLLQEFIFDTQEDPMPFFEGCPEDLVVTPCDWVVFNLYARHVVPSLLSGIECELISGPGEISTHGFWTFEPTEADIGQTYEVEIAAHYGPFSTTGDENCRFSVTVVEQALGFVPLDFTCGDSLVLPAPMESLLRMRGYADDCQRLMTRNLDVSPPFAGSIELLDARTMPRPGEETHLLEIVPDATDMGTTFDIRFEGWSEYSSEVYFCSLTVTVEEPQPYRVRIETKDSVVQGEHTLIDVVLEEGIIPFEKLSFVIAYPMDAIAPTTVVPGPWFQHCEWEELDYRVNPYGSWPDSQAMASILISAVADFSYGTPPICFIPDDLPATLFTIDFTVTDDRMFECDSVPIGFHWTRCLDNRIKPISDKAIFVSRDVYDSDGLPLTPSDVLPSFAGMPDSCHDEWSRYSLHRLIDFHGGGIHIMCADSIDPRYIVGDVNLNRMSFEIADVVLFSNYFVYGEGVLAINLELQTLASDVNGDSLVLTIEDLQYMIQVIVGEADPYHQWDTTSSNPAFFRQESDGSVSVLTPDTLGAAWLVFDGMVDPVLQAGGMEMRYQYSPDGGTRVLIYSYDGQSFTAGPLLSNVDAPLLEVQTCTYNSAKVEAIIDQSLGANDNDDAPRPDRFALMQNYPNPFNNSTVIRFDLPRASEVRLTVYNIIGQMVLQRTRYYQAGFHEFVWDGRSKSGDEMAGGVYFYQLQAGSFTSTKKMLLLK